ncbi:hypothetical protein GCM10009676_14690 [Prauserella halophila]|uniref:ATP synthase protein I n=1 Tax=Prauserella halophila TaxID=185641 RepID=A0ABN1W2C2_9PSEU|nr:hypothetical protein [Prauserella halophila]
MNAETESETPADADAVVRAEHARSVHRLADAMLSWGLRISLPLSLLTLGVAVLAAGADGLVGGGVGIVLGQGSALVTITMMRLAASRGPNSLLGFALGGYALKMTALLVVMLLLRDVDGFSRPALAFGMLVVVVAWAAGEVVAFQRTKTPTLVIPPSEPEPEPEPEPADGAGSEGFAPEESEPGGGETGNGETEGAQGVRAGTAGAEARGPGGGASTERDAADISGTADAARGPAQGPAHTRSGKRD